MNLYELVFASLLFGRTFVFSDDFALKTIQKRLVNGSPIDDFDRKWSSTVTVEIFHISNNQWLKHPVCLGSFLQVGESYMVITAADCFFPPGYDHSQFSYMSAHHYRVFLGVIRLHYGHNNYTRMDQFEIRSSVRYTVAIIHPEWQFGRSTEDTNIAIISITPKCVAKLTDAFATNQIAKVPSYLTLSVLEAPVTGFCRVAGWKTDLHHDPQLFDYLGLDHQAQLVLNDGWFFSQSSYTCNQHFDQLHIQKTITDPSFCISGTYGVLTCPELYLSTYEYGSGAICNGSWSGFVSAIFGMNIETNDAPSIQFATISPATTVRRFVDNARFSSNASCAVVFVTVGFINKGGENTFNPHAAKDYAHP